GSSGGLFLTGSQTLTRNNVTITANAAQVAGGLGTGPMASVTFANTIIAGNSAPTGPDCSIAAGTLTSAGFNLVGDNTDCAFTAATGDQVGTGGAPIDPLLGALADNGGPDAGATPTPIPTHFPQPGSPALDAGNNVDAIGGAFPACRADDQRDVARPVGPRCDIGAVESSADADLAITKADSPDPVNRGDNLTYTLTVTNNGPGGAGDVQVVDNLPAGLAFVSAMPSQGTCMEAALMVTCDLGIVASGGNATIDIVVTTTAAGMLTNTATVTTTSNDPDVSNNTDTENTVVNPVTDISVTKTDDADPVDVGDNITYTVTVTNNGPDNATGVSLMDTLPASVNFVSATPSQGMCAEAGGLVTCNLGALANGNSATVTIVVTTTANAVITNTVTVTADGGDSNPGNNQASENTSVGTMAELILSMADSPDPVAVVTGNLTYTVTVANAGADQATGVTVTVTLPTSVNFGSANATMGTCSQTAITVTCNIGTLALQASATATIVVIPQTPGITITGTATVTLNEADPDLNNNTASVDTEVVDFTLSVAPASVTVTRGNSAIYMVTLTPVGSRFDFAIALSCEMLPASTTCAFLPAGVIPGGGPITATLSVITTAPSSAELRSPLRTPFYAAWLLGMLVLGAGRRRRARAVLGLLLLLLVLQTGCGGSDAPPPPTTQPGTPVGTHTFTIRGTTGTLSHTATTMVVVQ
ncbi:MAG: choice-of-anchor Q domain-containing protein, partial [Candidatus Acidiferrales bacterium]